MDVIVFMLGVWSVAVPVVMCAYYNWRIRNLVDQINYVNQHLNMRVAMLHHLLGGAVPPPPTRPLTDAQRAKLKSLRLRVPPVDGGPA